MHMHHFPLGFFTSTGLANQQHGSESSKTPTDSRIQSPNSFVPRRKVRQSLSAVFHTMARELKDVKLVMGSTQGGENKDLIIYIEEGELIAVEPIEIYKFQLGPDDENLTLQVDKDLQIHIQGRDIRVVELRQKFRFPLGSAKQDENPALQINEDQDIYIPGVQVKEELKEPSKGENLAQQIYESSIPAGGSGKSTDAPPAMMFYLPSDDDSE